MTLQLRIVSILCLLTLICVCSNVSASPTLSIRVLSIPEPVFDTKAQSCELIDIPDTSARAFRDSSGTVHLFASHYVTRAMVGKDLSSVRQDCAIVYRSRQDKDPADFADFDWLSSFYTFNGRNVVALVHNEYHGWSYPKMCLNRRAGLPLGQCWWNTVDFAISSDGGYSFRMLGAPGNLIASLPFRYDPKTELGAVGYFSPSNILRRYRYFYTMINTWPYKGSSGGSCVMRTENLLDPTSWRAWDGASYSVEFQNPYLISKSGKLCKLVYPGFAQGLVYYPAAGLYLVSELTHDGRYGAPGFYLSSSHDLIHWKQPILVVSIKTMEQKGLNGKWKYDYFSLLDPNSSDQNFSTISNNPYMYYVRFDLKNAPYTRILFREKIKILQIR